MSNRIKATADFRVLIKGVFMSFLIGCNYWASNAGIEMWRQFDADVIRRDENRKALRNDLD